MQASAPAVNGKTVDYAVSASNFRKIQTQNTYTIECIRLLCPNLRTFERRDGGIAAEYGQLDILLDRRIGALERLGGGGAREPRGGLGREGARLGVHETLLADGSYAGSGEDGVL